MLRNSAVAQAWREGRWASSNRLHTDGASIYSYGLRIGYTAGALKVCLRYQAPHFRSLTTSYHVALVSRCADITVGPDSLAQEVIGEPA